MSRTAYLKQLNTLADHMSELGSQVVQSIRDTARAVGDADANASKDVQDRHNDSERLRRSIEDSCMNLMLLQQPLASDLRLVTGCFRSITDLARIDEMAYETALLIDEYDIAHSELAPELSQLAEKVARMVEKALKAFEGSDVQMAEEVFPLDNGVDELFEKIRSDVVELLKTGAEPASVAPEVLTIAKYYERMGDHSQSIADWAIFRATGSYRGRTMGDKD